MRFPWLILILIAGCSGSKCNEPYNPTSKDYPCGTRAHPCSIQPLMCCWNNEVCGGPVGTGCPAGMCCYVGDDYVTLSPSGSAEVPRPNTKPQWNAAGQR